MTAAMRRPIRATGFSSATLERFAARQRWSFSILEQTAAELQPGQTEREVARALMRRYRASGATAFFHLPVVLFGERTALPGDWSLANFYPKRRALRPGDSVILDAAPILDGLLVDTSYSFCFGDDPRHRQMMQDLRRFRGQVRDAVDQGQSFRQIASDVAAEIKALGYAPVHAKHPGGAFGHRALKTTALPLRGRFRRFDGTSLGWFLAAGALSKLGRRWPAPVWSDRETSDHPPADGLWMVEPHAGHEDVGAKWEEILVIEGGRARWLDDQPPHVRQWSRIESGLPYGPEPSAAAR